MAVVKCSCLLMMRMIKMKSVYSLECGIYQLKDLKKRFSLLTHYKMCSGCHLYSSSEGTTAVRFGTLQHFVCGVLQYVYTRLRGYSLQQQYECVILMLTALLRAQNW
jgi:hypothetical protein